MNAFNKNILWLASWYPSELKPYDGDFIQRHAKAASYYNKIYVIHVVKDISGDITKNKKVVTYKSENLTEVIIYYYMPLFGLLGKVLSEWRYRSIYKKAILEYIKESGKPKIVHVHITMKAGIIAKWISLKYKIPYIITEHWSGLLTISKPSLRDYPLHFQIAYKKVINGAIGVSAVSKYLAVSLREQFDVRSLIIIPNVVDISIFRHVRLNKFSIPRFIHISSFENVKNTNLIISAFGNLKSDGYNFQLCFVGPENEKLKKDVSDVGIIENVIFYNEMSQSNLSALINQSDALVLFSQYETFGCVVIEANACGVPVIVSDIPTMKEVVTEGFNGMLASNGDIISLTSTIKSFISNRQNFNSFDIAKHTSSLYNFNRIGKMFDDWYISILN